MKKNALLATVAMCLACPGLRAGADPQCEINVNVVMTEAGKKTPRPTAAKPGYYFPLVVGYREKGTLVAGEIKPPVRPIVHTLARTLAQQNYFVISKEHPQPSILLVFTWGYMNPQIDDFGPPDESQTVFSNQREMLALVGADTAGPLGFDLNFEREEVMQAAEDDRYFVIVSAYDFAAARQHKKVLLWQTRMSTPSTGVTLAEVIPSLIAGGGPLFGSDTQRPKWVTMPLAREGRVEIGSPTIKEYFDNAPARPKTNPEPAPAAK